MTDVSSVAVVTIAAGRHTHLRNQIDGLSRSTDPYRHVVVSMADPDIDATIEVPAPSSALPLAHARNAGARVALDGGADLLVFLDVDCIPGPDLLRLYREAAEAHPRALLCGPVTYLPESASAALPLDPARWTSPHPARPNPPHGKCLRGVDHDLFWSLSFAVTASTWLEIGGFCEDYRGYGGEDTDFSYLARAAGTDLQWVGGAHAYHQYHPVSSPPVEHLKEIVENARVFRRRWGTWPMTGWLDEFERSGLIHRDGEQITPVGADLNSR